MSIAPSLRGSARFKPLDSASSSDQGASSWSAPSSTAGWSGASSSATPTAPPTPSSTGNWGSAPSPTPSTPNQTQVRPVVRPRADVTRDARTAADSSYGVGRAACEIPGTCELTRFFGIPLEIRAWRTHSRPLRPRPGNRRARLRPWVQVKYRYVLLLCSVNL
jgi:hypothetical protein